MVDPTVFAASNLIARATRICNCRFRIRFLEPKLSSVVNLTDNPAKIKSRSQSSPLNLAVHFLCSAGLQPAPPLPSTNPGAVPFSPIRRRAQSTQQLNLFRRRLQQLTIFPLSLLQIQPHHHRRRLSRALCPAASHRHHSLCRTASISQPPSPSTISAMSAASLLGHAALRSCPHLSPLRFQKPIPAAIGTDLPVPRFQVGTITVAPIPRRADALIQRRRRRSPSLAATGLSLSPLSVPDKIEERNCSKMKS